MSGYIEIPEQFFEQPEGRDFPTGSFIGKVAAYSNVEEHPRVTTTAWDYAQTRLEFRMRENEAVDGDDPGGLTFGVNIPFAIEHNGKAYDYENMPAHPDDGGDKRIYWPLVVGMTQMSLLAYSLGYTDDYRKLDWRGFVEEMEKGTFTGSRLGFQTYPRTYPVKDGKDGDGNDKYRDKTETTLARQAFFAV